ncbi:Uncharacterised protein [Escherichia coli]|nr:Uncharacterised protein [Escherichia coli]VVZ73035.1 Uncharacterised protein [Escherichia coli]VWN03961.1 Uncharacterised protein [Escherichia coli]
MNEAEKSIFHSRSMQVHGLQFVDELYIRARMGKMSYLGSPVLVVATISVKTPGQGFFRELLSKLKEAAETNNLILKIENVINTELRDFLTREGFSFPGERWMCGSGYWAPSSLRLNDHLCTLPV